MDDHITESISKDKKNQLNLSAPLKKVANKKKSNINLTLYKSIINDHNYLLNSMFNKRYYNINEIYNTAMYNTKTYSTIISKSDLSNLKDTNWLYGDVKCLLKLSKKTIHTKNFYSRYVCFYFIFK